MGVDRRVVTPGLLVSLEGLDGVGKTTQIERLSLWLGRVVPEVMTVREPGGTPFGEALRELILHQVEAKSGLAEFLVFAAARAELMATVVNPALDRGAVVLMDRFIDSSVAYQAFGHGLNPDIVMNVNAVVTEGRKPDLTVWLRGEPFVNAETDRFEARDIEYFRQVDAGYGWLAQQDSDRWLILESHQSVDTIFHTMRDRIQFMLQHAQGGE